MRPPLLLVLALTLACTAEVPRSEVALTFRAEVGGEPFACGSTYDGVGSPSSTFTALDFRFFVHDVRLVTEDGEEVPVALTDDDTWQNDEVALLDFETGGPCMSGNAPTNERVLGTIPEGSGPFTALRFRIGVPEHLNHLLAASQPAPLNVTSLFWGWAAGYEFMRVDGRTTELEFLTLLLGATSCTGDYLTGTRTCANTNRPEITVTMPSSEALDGGVIVADLAELFSANDMTQDHGGPPGCMSDASDPECATIFAALGMDLTGTAAGEQRVFRFEAP